MNRQMSFLIAVANATTVFLLNRLAVGIFSQDLLEIYWWFGAGIAISLIEMKPRSLSEIRSGFRP